MKNKILKLQQQNDVLELEKAIMEEKIRGLYEFWESISGKFSEYIKLENEFNLLSNSSAHIAKNELQNVTKLMEAKIEIDDLRSNYIEIEKIKEEYFERKYKLQKDTNEKLRSYQKEIYNLNEERDKLKTLILELEKKASDASEELKTIKLRNKKSRIFKGRREDTEEKFCALCYQVYIDAENFNWSCKTHKSKFTGERYWCCNAIGKDAPGCILSKHFTNEDLLDQEDENNAIKFCTECKEIGHWISACPKDPNIQTNIIPHEEIMRLKTISVYKRKQMNYGSELQDRAFEMVSRKVEGSEFAKFIDSDDEAEEIEGVFFRDLIDLKEDLEIGKNSDHVSKKQKKLFRKSK